MKLFEQDYTVLTAEDQAELQRLQREEDVGKLGSLPITVSRFRDYPKAARHYTSLFPNNYLDIVELKDEQRLTEQLNAFEGLLDRRGVTERLILNFINRQRAYFIVASLLKRYFTFGHHDAYLFREFPLGSSFRADYLLVGQSSGGWSYVFIEMESPRGRITLSDGGYGVSIRKGLSQVSNWDEWIDGNFSSLREIFQRYKNPEESLPNEFVTLDKSRIHYAVIAGRRRDFSDATYRASRKSRRDSVTTVLHYDNVVDAARDIIGCETF